MYYITYLIQKDKMWQKTDVFLIHLLVSFYNLIKVSKPLEMKEMKQILITITSASISFAICFFCSTFLSCLTEIK